MTGRRLTILIAYDGSEPARNAITHAGRLFPGAQVVVATVWTSMQDAARAAREGVELASEAGLAARPLTLKADGSVATSLLARVEELDAAAVVVGSRGRSAVKSALLGSVSNAIVHQSRRPVVVVHPADPH